MALSFGLTITAWAGLLGGKFGGGVLPDGRQKEFERLAQRRNEKRYKPQDLKIAELLKRK